MFWKKFVLFGVAIFAALYLTGCGGSSKPVSIAVTATATTVDGANTVTLTATVTNDKNNDGVTWSVTGGGALSNTSTTSATYTAPPVPASALSVTITATSVADTAKSGTVTLTVPGKLTITSTGGATGSLAGAVGTVYSVQLTTSTGIPPYTWSLASGSTLPACLSMTSAGLITSNGPLMASCAIDPNITFDVTDSGNPPMTASEQLDLVINPAPAIVFSTTTVPPATATFGVAYTGTVAASGGVSPLTYSATGLPGGLTLNATTGVISGSPTVAGTFKYAVTASDAYGDSSAPQTYTIVVTYPPVTVLPVSGTLPFGLTGTAYTAQMLTASGGSGKGFTWTVTGLPADGLVYSANGATLTVSGTPTLAQTLSFTAKVTDGVGNVSSVYTYSIPVYSPLALPATNPSTLSSVATINVAYSGTLTATGGSGNYSYAVTGLSDSLTSSTSLGTLTISGTPTATATVTFNVTVTDTTTNLTAGPISYTITVSNALTLPATNPSTLPSFAVVGTNYTGTIAAAGGSGNYSWAVTGLSDGLSSSSSGGTLTVSGKPTATGVVTFGVTLTDTTTQKSVGPVTYTITAYSPLALPATNPTTLPPVATINVAYSGTLTATGGSGNYSYAVTGLSDGLTSSTSGGVLTISGTPIATATATVTFNVTVTDTTTNLTAGPTTYTITANWALTLPPTNPSTLPTFAVVGVNYSGTIAAVGGSGNYSWAVTGLLDGLTSSSSGGTLTVSGKPTATGVVTFGVTLTDTTTKKSVGPVSYTITAYNALALPSTNPSTLPSVATTNVAYTGTLTATGGSGNYSYAVTGLSDSLTSSTSLGILTVSGTPTATATVTFNVTVTDTTTKLTAGPTAYTITVSNALTLPATNPSTLPSFATVGVSYSGTIAAAGGSGNYSWAVTGLPSNGLSSSTSGGTLTISGKPTATGAVTFGVTLTDTTTQKSVGPISYTITAYNALTLPATNPSTLSSIATTNVAYSGTVTASGGSGNYSYAVTGLSDSLTSSTSGGVLTVSGTPTATGAVTFNVTVTDTTTKLTAGPVAYTITAYNALTLPATNPSTLPSLATVGVNYTGTIAAVGGSGNYSWAVVGLFDGLSSSSSGGTLTISGKPTSTGEVTFAVTLTDTTTQKSVGPIAYTITAYNQLAVSAMVLPTGYPGTAYPATSFAATGGSGTYTKWVWTAASGSALPSGLTLAQATGAITGTPANATTSSVVSNFTVTVTDSVGETASASFSLTIEATLAISTTSPLPSGLVGKAYSQQLNAVGGTGTYGWAVTSGAGSMATLGLSLSSSGLLTAPAFGSTGSATFTAQVSDNANPAHTASLTFTLNVTTFTITTTSLPSVFTGSGASYNQTLSVSGGTGPFTWSTNTAGTASLAAVGLTLSSGGVISNGSSTLVAGTASFTVTVKDSVGDTASQSLVIHVYNPLALPASGSLAGATTNTAYNGSIVATGGSGSSYAFTVNVGSTPTAVPTNGTQLTVADSIWVSNNGSSTLTIGGTPTLTQVVTLTVSVQQGAGGAGNTAGPNAYTIAVNPPSPLALPAAGSLAGATTNTAYNGSIVATGGSGSGYVFTVNVGSTPTAVPTTGTQVTVADSIWVSNNGSSTLTIGGTPTLTQVVTLTVSVKDGAGDKAGANAYTIAVNPPSPLTLPASGSLAGATTNVAYNGAINASGGSGSNYTFTVNVGSTPTTVPTNGTQVTVADSIWVSNTGGNTLTIGGTPTLTEVVTLTVSVKDGAGDSAGPIAYTIAVNPPTPLTLPASGSLTSATLDTGYTNYINANGGSGQGYSFTVNTTLVTNANDTPETILNAYGLTGTNNGGNTLTIGGTPTSAVTITLNVTVTDSANDSASGSYTIIVINPNAGYTVSGTVSYSGTQTGWVYLELSNSSCNSGCGNSSLGTAISAPGAFTINGVPAGTYTLTAFMDTIGYGAENAANPAGSTSNVIVSDVAVPGVSLTLKDPGAVSLSSAPKWDPSQGSGAFSGGAFVTFDPIKNSNGMEMPNSYLVEWSTSSDFSSGVAGSGNFPATGNSQPWIVNGMTNNQTYYFRAAGIVGSGLSMVFGPWSTPEPSGGLTIGAPTGGTAVSGKVTFAGTATGPLYVGFYNQSTSQIYATQVGSITNPPKSPASYSVNVPAGSNYYFFGILDQSNTGLISAPGEISNTNGQNVASVTISGTTETENLDLTPDSASAVAIVKTRHAKQITSSGTNNNYAVGFRINGQYKLPVSVELVSGSNQDVVMPADYATGAFNGNTDEFDFWPSLNGATPKAGDTYTLNVAYSDGTSNSTANTPANPLTVTVGAVLNAFASSPTPASQATGVSLTPTFSWTDPSSASSYVYQFQLQDSNNNTIWQIPADHSNTNGFASTITTVYWGVDPTGNEDNPSVTELNGSSNYWWSIQAADSNDDEAEIQWEFTTAEAPLALTPPCAAGSTCPLGAGEFSQYYTYSIVASGGSGSGYNFTVTGTGVTANSSSSWTLPYGLSANSNGNTLTISGLPNSVLTIPFSITVSDSDNNTASGSYSIAIGNTGVGFTVTGNVNYSGQQSGWVYLSLNSTNSCYYGCSEPTPGTAISPAALAAGGAFTIRGVQPGKYYLYAWMDNLGYGAQNASNPTGSTSNFTVANAALSGASVTLSDPSSVTLTSAPAWDPSQGAGIFTVGGAAGGAMVSFDTIKNDNGVEIPASYLLEYTTDSTFETGVTSVTFPATGGNSPWLVSGLTAGDTYYFKAAGVLGSGGFATPGPLSSTSSGVTITAPAGNAISGMVTFNGTATGPLYVGFYNMSTGVVYGEKVKSPVSPQAYGPIDVPTGSNYFFFGIIDQNNTGLINVPGEITNTNQKNMTAISITGASSTEDLDLTPFSINSSAAVTTEHYDDVYPSTENKGYQLNFNVGAALKLPVAVALTSGANLPVLNEVEDIAQGCNNNCNSSQFGFNFNIGSAVPSTGQAYGLSVTYSDGATATPSPAITGVVSTLPYDLSPTGIDNTSTQPTFNWSDPANPSAANGGPYTYQFQLRDDNNNTIWEIPNKNSNSSGFASSYTSIPWNTTAAPNTTGNAPTVSSLTSGDIYYWQIQATDTYGNWGQYRNYYVPGYTALALPAASSSTPGPATIDQSYNVSIQATGGYGGYSYSINGTSCFGCSGTSLGDNLYVTNANSALAIAGVPTATGQVIFTVYAQDQTGTQVGPVEYMINVVEATLSLPTSGTGSALVGYAYSQSLFASGGSGSGYVFTVNSSAGTTSSGITTWTLTDGLTATSTVGSSMLTISGTPTTVTPAGSPLAMTVSVTDSQSHSAGPVTYYLDVVSPPNGTNNKYLSGTYVCKVDGFSDDDSYRYTSLFSFVANGAGGIASGVFDENGRDFATYGEMTGTFTGSYSVDSVSPNNGLLTADMAYTYGGVFATSSITYAIALNNTSSATTASEFRITRIDTEGRRGTGDCYLANTKVFGTDVFAGNSFVFKMDGEDGNGDPEATLGRFVASSTPATNAKNGSITGGVIDQAKITSSSETESALSSSSYALPDATNGRAAFTFSTSSGTADLEMYVIDANRMFMIETDDPKAQSGEVRKQIVTSYGTTAFTGSPFVTYEQGYEYSDGSLSGYDSMVMQATGSSTGDGVVTGTVNQMYQDENGDYQAGGKSIGATSTVTIDNTTNLGRATITVSGSTDTMIAYYFNTGSAFQLDFNGSHSYLATGWTEPQTETTFTNAAVAGTYLMGQMARMEPDANDNVGEWILSSSGCTTSGGVTYCPLTGDTTTVGVGTFTYDQSNSMSYNWDTTVTGTGSYLVGSGSKGISCVVISATRTVCIFNKDLPSVMILQQ
jgi:hypothetical protein